MQLMNQCSLPHALPSAPLLASPLQSLKERVISLIPQKQAELKEVSSKYGDKSLGNVTVSQVRPSAEAMGRAAEAGSGCSMG